MSAKHPLSTSFKFAVQGLAALFRLERNARLELAIAIAACGLCAALRVSAVEWALVLLSAGAVLAAEAMNTAIETLADSVHPKRSPGIGLAKDLAAAAVLITAMASLLVAAAIFTPRLWALFARA